MALSSFWVALGIVVLIAGLLDVFLTALNYDEAGFLASRLCALQWRGLRGITRRLSRRWRPAVLRQTTGLNIMLNVLTWLGCVVVGFGLIYYGLMFGTNFQYDGRDLANGPFAAMYLSAAQLATVGTSQVTPETDALRTLSILETLTGVALVSLILTFLFGVYQVVRDLRTLSANFVTAEGGVSDPVASLGMYFPEGQMVGLEAHLQAISESFWSYADGLRQHHAAYYFQSGRDQFSLPYVLHMLGHSLAALRWGLPSGYLTSIQPLLTQLSFQFEHFTDYLHNEVGWTSAAVPEIVPFEEFAAAYRTAAQSSDLWLGRFLRVNRDMGEMAKLDRAPAPQEAYERYRQWLPFAYRAEQMMAAISRDLDYQPIVHGGERARVGADGPPVEVAPAPTWRALLNRWVIAPDPGLTRLVTAARATGAAVGAVATLYLVFWLTNVPELPPAMFGGMMGMYATTMPDDATAAGRRATTLLAVLPAIGGVALGAAIAPSFALAVAALVVIVLLGVWAGALGPRLGALGQMAFMALYFGLLLHVPLGRLPAFAGAAVVGAIWAYVFRFVLTQRPARVLRVGLAAFRARLRPALDPLIDAVSAARWDPDLRSRVRANMRQLHRSAAFLQGQLRAVDPNDSKPTQAGNLRLQLFDTELAATNAVAAASDVARAGTIIPVVLRARLAGLIEQSQDRLRHANLPADDENPAGDDGPPESWPEPARRLHGAIRELLRASTRLGEVLSADVADPRMAADEIAADTSSRAPQFEHPPGAPHRAPTGRGPLAPVGRRAIQAAVATGLALVAGAAVTTTHQYWAALAAFVVLAGTETLGETVMKGAQRIAGTIIGAGVGFGVAIVTGADPFVVLPLLVICVFAEMYLRPVSYSLMVFWVTMMIALLYEFLGALKPEALEIRILETIIGAVIALAVAAFLLPTRTRQKLNGDAAMFLRTLDEVIQACLERLTGTGDVSSLAGQALALDQRLRQLASSATPLRRGFGALRRDGIERRLTALAAMTYYARHLITTTEALAPGVADLPKSGFSRLAASTRGNISALIRILEGAPPGPAHATEGPTLDLEVPQGPVEIGNARREAALSPLARINQAVLGLIEDLTHDGSADRSAFATPT